MDTITPAHRSWNMGQIRSKDTKPEMVVRSFLHRHGFRFRLHVKTLPGKPDIVLPKYKTVIEVRGCFWHRHPGCKLATMPSSHVDFWQAKFQKTTERDILHEAKLKALGWKYIVIWTCQLHEADFLEKLPEKIKGAEKPSWESLPEKLN